MPSSVLGHGLFARRSELKGTVLQVAPQGSEPLN